MNTKQFREAGKKLIDHIADYYDNIENIPVIPNVQPGFLINSFPKCIPQQGDDFSQILADYRKHIFPGVSRVVVNLLL